MTIFYILLNKQIRTNLRYYNMIYAEPVTKQGEWVSVKYCVPRLIMICAAAASLYLTTTTTTVRFLPLLALLSIRLYHVCLGSFCNTICHQYIEAREGGMSPIRTSKGGRGDTLCFNSKYPMAATRVYGHSHRQVMK